MPTGTKNTFAKPNAVTHGLVAAARQIREFMDTCSPDFVTNERVTAWVDNATELLKRAQGASLGCLGPDHSNMENLQMRFKLFGLLCLSSAPWLSDSTKARLIRFRRTLPQFIASRYRLTYDSFSARRPQWEKDLRHIAGAPNLRFLEIGSREGQSACWLLENILTHETSRLTCIDVFRGPAHLLFRHNIALCDALPKVTAIAARSEQVLPTLNPSSYDLVYVDGSHEQVNVLQDAVFGWRLLKSGGVMTFDDYLLKRVPITQAVFPARPDIAIDAFLSIYKGRYDLIYTGYHISLSKRL